MTNKLCDKLFNGEEQNRDIASIALKTIVEVPSSLVAQSVLVSISPKLIRGIVMQEHGQEFYCEPNLLLHGSDARCSCMVEFLVPLCCIHQADNVNPKFEIYFFGIHVLSFLLLCISSIEFFF